MSSSLRSPLASTPLSPSGASTPAASPSKIPKRPAAKPSPKPAIQLKDPPKKDLLHPPPDTTHNAPKSPPDAHNTPQKTLSPSSSSSYQGHTHLGSPPKTLHNDLHHHHHDPHKDLPKDPHKQAQKVSSTRSTTIDVSRARPLWDRPWRTGHPGGSGFNIVQFFEFVRLELEKELKGEIGLAAAAGGEGAANVDPAMIHTLKERVAAEFEKTKRSFEEEMEQLKQILKANPNMSTAELENEMKEASRRISNLLSEQNELEKKLDAALTESKQFSARLEKFSKNIEYISQKAPEGRVTLVFTDVQGSTTQWEMHPQVMEKALELHDAVMRSSLEEYSGYEVKTEGDAFFASFERPLDAIRFCLKVQEELLKVNWPEEVYKHPDAAIEYSPSGTLLYKGLRVRMGVHTGEPTCNKNPITGRMDYFGPMVNRSARIESVAKGGQVVLSDATLAEIENYLEALENPEIKDLGMFKLKGLDSDQRIYQILPLSLKERVFEVEAPSAPKLLEPKVGPKGDVTLVFTDVKSSTSLWEMDAAVMKQALQYHNELMRSLLGVYDGYEVKTEGDAFMIAFSDPLTAVKWAGEVQLKLLEVNWPEAIYEHPDAKIEKGPDGEILYRGLKVRMGIHTGQPLAEEDPVTRRTDYFGPMVNRSARVESVAAGGQVMISGSTWDAIKDRLADDLAAQFEWKYMGEYELKGLEGKEKITQILPKSISKRVFDNQAAKKESKGQRGPKGSVAVVCTAIQGSNRQWTKNAEVMKKAFNVHNSILRERIGEHSGYEVKVQGDSFIVVFANPLDAIKWSLVVQELLLDYPDWPEELLQNDDSSIVKDAEGNVIMRGLRVRIGLHFGQVFEEEDPITGRSTYYGPVVNTAVQLEKISHGGQIVLTSELWEVVKEAAKALPQSLTPLGVVEIEANTFCNLYQLVPKRAAGRKFSNLRVTASKSGPTGKVTLVFTDIQGSTPQWDADPETMEQALQLHNEVFRNLMKEFHGYEVKTEGDAFMIAFANAVDAIKYCIKIQYALLEVKWPDKLYWNPESAIEIDENDQTAYRGLRVRMGILTGEPICSEDPITGRTDYFGPVVNRAARVQSAANGGQIIMSGSTWNEIAPFLDTLDEKGPPVGIPLGEFRLKGLDTKEALIELKPHNLQMRRFPPPFSKIEASPAKEATAKLGTLTKTNDKLSANLNVLSGQLNALSVQSNALKDEMATLEARYVSAISGDDEQSQKQRAEFMALSQKMEKLLHSQQRLETQLNGTTQETKEFSSILTNLQADSMAEANKIAEQLIESVASKHRMELESNRARIAELTANMMELESSLNDYRADREAMEEELIEKNAEYETALVREAELLKTQKSLEETIQSLKSSLENAERNGAQNNEKIVADLERQRDLANKLAAELATLQNEKASLQETTRSQVAELEELKRKLELGEKAAGELQQAIKGLENSLKETQESSSKRLEEERHRNEEEEARLLAEIASLKAQFEQLGGASKERAEMEEELRRVREELTKKFEELTSASSERERQLQEKIAQLEKGGAELERERTQVAQELTKSQEEADKLRTEISGLTLQIQDREKQLEEGVERLKAAEATHKAEVEKHTTRIAELTQELAEKERACEGHLAAFEEEKGKLTEEREQIRTKLASQLLAQEELEKKLSESTQEVQSLTQQLEDLQNRKAGAEAELASMERTKQEQENNLQALGQHLASLQADLQAAKEQTSKVEEAKRDLEATLDKAREQEQILTEQLEQKNQEFSVVVQECNEFKAKLDAIEESARQKAVKRISRGSGYYVSQMLDKFEGDPADKK